MHRDFFGRKLATLGGTCGSCGWILFTPPHQACCILVCWCVCVCSVAWLVYIADMFPLECESGGCSFGRGHGHPGQGGGPSTVFVTVSFPDGPVEPSPCVGSQQLLGSYNWPVLWSVLSLGPNKLSLGPTQLNSRPFAEGALSQALEVCPDPGGSRVSPRSAC